MIDANFDVCSSNHQCNAESVAAFNTVKVHTSPMRKLILKEFKDTPGGLTCDEIELKLNIKHQTASARLRELVDDHELVRTPGRRPTRSGCQAAVLMTPEQSVNHYCRTAKDSNTAAPKPGRIRRWMSVPGFAGP